MNKYNPYRIYEGNKNYIFASYSHKDEDRVIRILEQLAKHGCRLWYDNGINPGSNWPEVIAGHLNNCKVFLSFISKNAVNSHNCRREINFAVLKKKAIITVFLEDTVLSPGMEMQLSAMQFIEKHKLSDEEFYEKLLSDSKIKECIGKPDKNIKIPKGVNHEPQNSYDNLWLSKEYTGEKDFYFIKNTVFSLIRKNTGEKIRINPDNFRIGRKSEFCDYTINGNKTISRLHATIKIRNEKCIIYDNDSLNGVYINGAAITPNIETELVAHDEIRLGSEKFILVADEEEDIKNTEE